MHVLIVLVVIIILIALLISKEKPSHERPRWSRKRKDAKTRRQRAYSHWLEGPVWAKLRAQAKKRDGQRCQDCGSTKNLVVHHIRYRDDWDDTRLEDLVTLCKPCHKKRHRRNK